MRLNCAFLASFLTNSSGLILSSFLLLLFFSCGQEKRELPWIEQTSGTTTDLTSVYFTNDSTGHAVGGKSFFLGVYLTTHDGGGNWRADSIINKKINSIQFTPEGRGHHVGVKGLLRNSLTNADWWLQGLALDRSIPTMNDLYFWNNDHGVIVGGVAFQDGYVLRLGADYSVVALDSFENELSAVFFSDENTVHAVGYGLVLRSTDGGTTWVRNEVKSDFYRSVHFPSPQTGYAVGYSGTIIKTTDAGVNWEKLRNGDKITVGDKPFRSVFFVSEDKGYIVGDGGLFWTTSDGGDNWQAVNDFPDVDLHDIFVVNGKGYIVGAAGKIFHFDD